MPPALKQFFWDSPFEGIDRTANKRYVISRILEIGDESAVKWLESEYSSEDLRMTVRSSRALSPKSRTYWKLKYRIA
jgi:hypothetical protein